MDGNRDRLKALEAAVRADPDFLPLRFRLAAMLLEAGEATRALAEYAAILAREPSNLEALRGARDAAALAGDGARERSYDQLLDALDEHPLELREKFKVVDGTRRFAGEEEPDPLESVYSVEDPGITLADVAGLSAVKRRLELSFLGPMRHPEARKLYGKSLRGGLLLYGPPGCGKTYVARALAGEMQARFLAVALSDVYDMWLGESERKLKEIFALARRKAPSVLFFDEIDALGHKRSRFAGAAAARNLVNALLHEMDGIRTDDSEGVYYLAATNHPWDVDTALRRPGRFDRTVLVLPPDQEAREAIVRYQLRDRPAAGVDAARIAAMTDEFSGADLAHLCESAAELALEASIADGQTRPISDRDFKQAIKDIKPSLRAWFDAARNYAMFANEGGLYDELLDYIRAHKY